jgi:hypothetical protein
MQSYILKINNFKEKNLLSNNFIKKIILSIKNFINKNILNNKTIAKLKTFKELEKTY